MSTLNEISSYQSLLILSEGRDQLLLMVEQILFGQFVGEGVFYMGGLMPDPCQVAGEKNLEGGGGGPFVKYKCIFQ